MAHRRLLVDRVLVAAWKTPEAEDARVIVEEVTAARGRIGRPLLYLSVIARHAIPRGEVRDRVIDFYQSMLGQAESMHVVIEGTDFQESIKRSVIANVLLVVPARRVFIENTLAGVIAVSPPSTRAELANAARAADQERLFDFARSG